MTNRTTLGIVGLGTVGIGVVELLRNNPQFEIRRIAVKDLSKEREIDLTGLNLTSDPFTVADDPTIEIIVEVAGGVNPAYEVIKQIGRAHV